MNDIILRNMTGVYLLNGNNILLLFRQGSRVKSVNGTYISSAGGHIEKDELNDPRACVLRELKEELGLAENDIGDLCLRYVTLRLVDGEIRQNYYYFAELKVPERELNSNEGRLEWFSIDDLADKKMPFTARGVITHYVSTGRFTEEIYAGNVTGKGVEFSVLKDI